MKAPFFFPLLFIISLNVSTLAAERQWTNQKGQEITASFVSVEQSNVVLEMNGKKFSVPISSLSAADQDFIKSQEEPTSPTGEAEKPSTAPLTNFDKEIPKAAKVDDDSVEDKGEKDGKFIYESKHFRFVSNVQLSKSLVQNFSRLFEASYELCAALPLGLTTNQKGDLFPIELFETEQQYRAAGGPAGSAGVFITNEGRVLVPLSGLGVKKVGSSYMYDASSGNATTLIHEVTHQLTPLVYDATAWGWFTEGIAEYCANMPYRTGRFKIGDEQDLLDQVTAYGEDDKGGWALGDDIQIGMTLEQWLNQSPSQFMSNTSLNYGVGALVTFYFLHYDDGRSGKPIREFARATFAGAERKEAYEKLLSGRSYTELAKEIDKAWRSKGVRVRWQDSL